ncbi:hypothetical protein VTI74DRAFT_6833 [Chaetomium olivicolor]
MPRSPATLRETVERRPTHDFELCKVVFGAAISQILYARRAFPPKCFQVLPLEQVVSRSFEDIVTSGSEVQIYDKELLRDQGNTVFLRQGTDYSTNRFLGILRVDIFPLVESECLVKFRINFLSDRIWGDDCLAEYYTITFKYEPDGRCWLDIWRAGTGQQHVSATDTQLWNLGDYLSRLPSWTKPMHWTLAFHATERPDDPPIGVWKFDRTDFDDANLSLQQRKEYAFARVARLEIMPPPPPDLEDASIDLNSDPQPELPVHQQLELEPPRLTTVSQTQRKRKRTSKPAPKSNAKSSAAQRRAAAGPQLSPPLTLASSRNASKGALVDKRDDASAAVKDQQNDVQNATHSSSPNRKKAPVTKRRPKRPLQLFEEATSSLPPTQIIGESQSLSQKTQTGNTGQNRVPGPSPTQRKSHTLEVPRSPSPDPYKLLDGISISPEAISATHSSPSVGLPTLQPTRLSTQLFDPTRFFTDDHAESLQLGPSSSVYVRPLPGTRWEPQASPAPPTPRNLLGITISEDEDETASEPEEKQIVKALPRPLIQSGEQPRISFEFERRPMARRTSSMFYDMPDTSGDEE